MTSGRSSWARSCDARAWTPPSWTKCISAVRTRRERTTGTSPGWRPSSPGSRSPARAVKTGEGEVFVAGGVESMTRAPYAVPKNLDGGMGNLTAWDTTLGWRFPNPRLKAQYGNDSVGETAENLRELDPQISREDQDRFALESHRRAIAAMESGRFAEEIVPVPIPQKGGGSLLVSRDEPPRPDTSLEALSKLRPVFREG